MSTRLRRATVLGHEVRVSVRPGTEPGPPLVICNPIGASLDLPCCTSTPASDRDGDSCSNSSPT